MPHACTTEEKQTSDRALRSSLRLVATPTQHARGRALERTATGSAEEVGSGSKKRRSGSVRSASEPLAKMMRAAPTTADTEAWLHRLDGELAERKASAVQLRCAKVAGRYRARALEVSGASPLRAVGFALAEALGVATCEGLRFTLQREGHQQAIGAALKKVQAVQEPGDSISVTMEDLTIAVTLDAMKFTDDRGFDRITDRPMSRCVGGDLLSPQRIKRLNRAFCAQPKAGSRHDRRNVQAYRAATGGARGGVLRLGKNPCSGTPSLALSARPGASTRPARVGGRAGTRIRMRRGATEGRPPAWPSSPSGPGSRWTTGARSALATWSAAAGCAPR